MAVTTTMFYFPAVKVLTRKSFFKLALATLLVSRHVTEYTEINKERRTKV